jgi:hypothetical protein
MSGWSYRPRPEELPGANGDRAFPSVFGGAFHVGNFDETAPEIRVNAAAAIDKLLDGHLDIILILIRMGFEHGLLSGPWL